MWDGTVDNAWLARNQTTRTGSGFPSQAFIDEYNASMLRAARKAEEERDRLDREAIEGAAS